MIDAREAQRQQLRAELKARLDRVRGGMTDDEFGGLIAAVERTAQRFAEIDAGLTLPSSRADG
jgi:hypothetical protein